MILGDNERLDEDRKRRVLERAGERGFACENCGSEEFEVGNALYLGFLFLSEDRDAYMVALTCKNPRCRAPWTGIRLHRLDFFQDR